MSNQVHNSDFYIGMTDDPYGTIGYDPDVLITSGDWCEYYRLAAERYQAFINNAAHTRP